MSISYRAIMVLMLTLSLQAREKARKGNRKIIVNESHYDWHHSKPVTKTNSASLSGTHTGLVETPGMAPLGYIFDGTTKVFRLTAQPIQQTITDGKSTHKRLELAMKTILGVRHINNKQTIKAWGYNGTSPGPTIEVTEGDKVRVIFKNELPEPTLLHWHGLAQPQDLEKSVDRQAVMPGRTHTYEFHARTPGTYLYHSGYSVFKQNRFGLVGMLIVHPKQYQEKVDKHVALMIQDWSLTPHHTPNTVQSTNSWFTLNGFAAPSIPCIVLKQGERVRFHIGHLALDPYPLKIHGYTWKTVGTEGGLIPQAAQIPEATLTMNPCTTRIIEFEAWNPGIWPVYALTNHHVTPKDFVEHGGIFTLMKVLPSQK